MPEHRLANLLIVVGLVLNLWGVVVFAVTPPVAPPCAPLANGEPSPQCGAASHAVTLESLVAWVIWSSLMIAGAGLRIWESRHPVFH